MGALHVAFVAPASQELVIFLLFLSRLVFLVSSCAGHLFGKFGCDKPVLSDNSVSRLLFAHFIDTRVTLVAGDVGHLPVHLGPDFFVCGLLLVIMVVVLLQLPQLSSAFRVFAVLAAVKLIVKTASLLRLMLLFHNFGFHRLYEALEGVELRLGLHLTKLTLRLSRLLLIREYVVHDTVNVLLNER